MDTRSDTKALRKIRATRYVTPLREGGSLPAVVEAEDDGLYVLKFRGAGQGPKSLIAELIGGEIARTLGLRTPELVFIDLDPALGRNEPDYEIRSLITSSGGLNLALDYLPGSITFDPLVQPVINGTLASEVVWLDAFLTNVDRTARNTNMLMWHKNLWLIDHAASLFFHHTWTDYLERSTTPFSAIKDHVLLPFASEIEKADAKAHELLSPGVIESIVNLLPDEWLTQGESPFTNANEHRAAYVNYLTTRFNASERFVKEAMHAR